MKDGGRSVIKGRMEHVKRKGERRVTQRRAKLKPWMRDAGITAKGAGMAFDALPIAMDLIMCCNSDYEFALRIMREANLRVNDFNTRDPDWVKKYLKENE